MNVIQFIKENGFEKAREVIDGIPSKYMSCYYSTLCYCTKSKKYSDRFKPRESLVNMGWLKRLVESVYLVKEHHTLDRAIEYANSQYTAPEIKVCLLDAIADYRSIYGGEHV